MKKTTLMFLLILITFFLFPIDLIRLYKRGEIKLTADPEFGKNTDFKELFFDPFKDICVAPDGSIFVANSRQHNIFKFDSQGKLRKKFGRRGDGPSDLNFPGDLSILDEHFLVVGQYALSRRISLFDLQGNFIKSIKTSRSCFYPLALKKGIIAYLGHEYGAEDSSKPRATILVTLVDTADGSEKVIRRIDQFIPMIQTGPQSSMSFGENLLGEVITACSIQGELLLGITDRPQIEIYSPNGKKAGSFEIKMPPLPITPEFKKHFKSHQINLMKKSSRYSNADYQNLVKKLEAASLDHLFGDILPYYNQVLVDAQGNILLFKKSECLGDCPILFQVYSAKGEFICDTKLDRGEFSLEIDKRFQNISFHTLGIFSLVGVMEEDDEWQRLVRIGIN